MIYRYFSHICHIVKSSYITGNFFLPAYRELNLKFVQVTIFTLTRDQRIRI